MANEIKVGDVVELKSGGPEMTVSDIKFMNGKNLAWCEWFDGLKAQKGTFILETLKQVHS